MRRHLPFAGHEQRDVGDAQRVQGLRVGCPAVREERAVSGGAARAQAGRAAVRRVVDHLPARLGGILALIKNSTGTTGKMQYEQSEHIDIKNVTQPVGVKLFLSFSALDVGNLHALLHRPSPQQNDHMKNIIFTPTRIHSTLSSHPTGSGLMHEGYNLYCEHS